MINSRNSRKNLARTERQQQKIDAGLVSTHYPDVAGIVIQMLYRQRGIARPLPRTINFFPTSSALFRIDCLSKDCFDGGFDLTQVITAMISRHREAVSDDLSCEGTGHSSGHADISYEVAIQYF